MKKRIIIMIIMALVLPIKINALTGSVNLNCSKTTLKALESTNCTITGNITEGVSSLSMKVDVGNNLTLINIQIDSSWQGDGEGGNIELYTSDNKTGNFPIATFTVKSTSVQNGSDTNVSLTNVKLYDANFSETNFTVQPVNIRIPSTINTLSGLKLNDISINEFSVTKTEYAQTVDSSTKNIAIAATPTDSHSQVTGDLGNKSLEYGINNFQIKVKSESGETKTYILTITRPESRELKKLLLNGDELKLESGVYEYNYTLNNEVTSINLEAKLTNEEKANFVDGFGERKINDIKVGNNSILIKVKDLNNEELTYKININRLDEEGKDTTVNKNPNTWSGMTYGILILITLVGVVVYLIIRRSSKFPKKA